MTVRETESVVELVRSILAETRELIRDELDLARAELREEVMSARAAGLALGGAAFASLLGLGLFCVALGSAVSYWFAWPAWAGYGIVSLLLFISAFLAMMYGRMRLSTIRALPNTRATLKENLAWIRSKSAPR